MFVVVFVLPMRPCSICPGWCCMLVCRVTLGRILSEPQDVKPQDVCCCVTLLCVRYTDEEYPNTNALVRQSHVGLGPMFWCSEIIWNHHTRFWPCHHTDWCKAAWGIVVIKNFAGIAPKVTTIQSWVIVSRFAARQGAKSFNGVVMWVYCKFHIKQCQRNHRTNDWGSGKWSFSTLIRQQYEWCCLASWSEVASYIGLFVYFDL